MAKLDTVVVGRTCLQEKIVLAWIGRVLVVVIASVTYSTLVVFQDKMYLLHTEVGLRVVPDLLGEAIDEGDVDDIDGRVRTDARERKLVRSLSPVHGHISRGIGIECC